jgi:MYXO-CTERM domain-containing protein
VTRGSVRAALLFLNIALLASVASAGIASVSGNITETTGSSVGDVREFQTQSESGSFEMLVFAEEKQSTFTFWMNVYNYGGDLTIQGNTPPVQKAGSGSVNSYFVHFDPNSSSTETVIATITFTSNEKILGVVYRDSLPDTDGRPGLDDLEPRTYPAPNPPGLVDPDYWDTSPAGSTLSNSDVTYPGYNATNDRGLELGSTNDNFYISSDLLSITITLRAGGSGAAHDYDNLRIITTPEPGTIALFGFGLLGLGAVGLTRYRRRRAGNRSA